MWGTATVVPRRKFVARNIYCSREETSPINNVGSHLKSWKEKKQNKPKPTRKGKQQRLELKAMKLKTEKIIGKNK